MSEHIEQQTAPELLQPNESNFVVTTEELVKDYAAPAAGEKDTAATAQAQPEEVKEYTEADKPKIEMPGGPEIYGPGPSKEDPGFKNSKDAITVMVSTAIGTADIALKRVFAGLASDDPQNWALTGDEKDELQKMWVPVAELYQPKINPLHMATAATVAILGAKGYTAHVQGKAKRKRMQSMQVNAGQYIQAVTSHASTDTSSAERNRFEIHANGRYRYSRNGKDYHAADDLSAEIPDVSDVEVFKKVLNKNGWKKVQKAYNLPENYRQIKGIGQSDEEE